MTLDLSELPAPQGVVVPSSEAIYQTIKEEIDTAVPGLDHTETSILTKILQVLAYLITLVYQRVNNGIRSCLVATATGSDLDNLGANFGVARKVIVPAVATFPTVPAVMEDDEAFRKRIILGPEGLGAAGPVGAYMAHALAVPGITAVGIDSPFPGEVRLSILGPNGAAPTQSQITAVTMAVNIETVRPLTDAVTVVGAAFVDFDVIAKLYIPTGPDSEIVRAEAIKRITAITQSTIGRSVYRSAIIAAAHAEGVAHIELVQPITDIEILPFQAARRSALNLTVVRA